MCESTLYSSPSSHSKSYIKVEDQNQTELDKLFRVATNPHHIERSRHISKPFRERDLPESFFQPPKSTSASSSTNSIPVAESSSTVAHHLHVKNQLSLPNIPSSRTIISNDPTRGHLRTASDTAVLDGPGGSTGGISQLELQTNSQISVLPMPEGWEMKKTTDGQTYFIDHLTQVTTWNDPRPFHYQQFSLYVQTLPLPDGYEQAHDLKGNTYYINHHLQQTQWDDPRLAYYWSISTKRLDTGASDSVATQPSISPIASTTSPHSISHRSPSGGRLVSSNSSTSGVSTHGTSAPVSSPYQNETLKQKLYVIMNEQRALQQRKEELERMEADVRKMLNDRCNVNLSSDQQANIDSILELLHHRRQNSEDSGVGEGRSSINRTPDALVSGDDSMFLNPIDYGNFPMEMDVQQSILPELNEPQLKSMLNIYGQYDTDDHGYSVKYSPHILNQLALVTNENYGIKGQGTLHIVQEQNGGQLEIKQKLKYIDALFDVTFSEIDPTLIVCAGADSSITLWKENIGLIQTFKQHSKEVWCVHWSESRTNDQLLSTSSDSTIKLWDLNRPDNHAETLHGHESIIYCAQWNPHQSGLISSVGADHSLRLWNIKQSISQPIFTMVECHPTEILCCDWSRYDSHLLVTGGCDNVLRLWDIRSMKQNCCAFYVGHESAIRRCKFASYTRNLFASVGYDMHLKLWDISGQCKLSEKISSEFVVLMISIGAAGHVIPMFELAKAMKNHNVTFITEPSA
ncbi:unnamed protein product [Didymodactylos carnosus]|uniref:Peroxin-7 n=1 Tax=Didymodactylos carnosus TaxID=1234261 RepID=A0A814DRJ9_9BILA|nr:unnamed protein product [Didymodactylos carnosus]CAF0959218.1 unnamed protein product [Didymodactylos carnosus]CAF3683463.1 unnamed protein product [Didymodactylos carnosus]CAF3733989.1 unnamed protein product [Didymodactylos carnosus]